MSDAPKSDCPDCKAPELARDLREDDGDDLVLDYKAAIAFVLFMLVTQLDVLKASITDAHISAAIALVLGVVVLTRARDL